MVIGCGKTRKEIFRNEMIKKYLGIALIEDKD